MTCALAQLVDMVDGLEIPIRPYAEAMRINDRETRMIRRIEQRAIRGLMATDQSGSLRIHYARIGGRLEFRS